MLSVTSTPEFRAVRFPKSYSICQWRTNPIASLLLDFPRSTVTIYYQCIFGGKVIESSLCTFLHGTWHINAIQNVGSLFSWTFQQHGHCHKTSKNISVFLHFCEVLKVEDCYILSSCHYRFTVMILLFFLHTQLL